MIEFLGDFILFIKIVLLMFSAAAIGATLLDVAADVKSFLSWFGFTR